MAPKREVGPDSHYAVLWCASKGYNAGSFWLGRAQLGLALLGLAFPSVLNFNEWQQNEQCSSAATARMICRQTKTSEEKLSHSLSRRRRRGGDGVKPQITPKVRPSNPVNSAAAAAVTVISQRQWTLCGHNN